MICGTYVCKIAFIIGIIGQENAFIMTYLDFKTSFKNIWNKNNKQFECIIGIFIIGLALE